MSDQPKIIDAEYEVVSPGRQSPMEYEQREPALRRFLLWANRRTTIPGDRTVDYLSDYETWRLGLHLAVNLAYVAAVLALLVGAGLVGSWGWHALGPVLGYRT